MPVPPAVEWIRGQQIALLPGGVLSNQVKAVVYAVVIVTGADAAAALRTRMPAGTAISDDSNRTRPRGCVGGCSSSADSYCRAAADRALAGCIEQRSKRASGSASRAGEVPGRWQSHRIPTTIGAGAETSAVTKCNRRADGGAVANCASPIRFQIGHSMTPSCRRNERHPPSV